ncbi:YwmB family TATA-box binding protein [Paenibacillus odorifer]|uniref:YwmB family TATA-box binding protein n=1 Tax=Paenibacillus odorifer TaxID=189426 RepID=UPI0020C05ECC|nr:YwmB family TATA-box binding protein [Paenibacillus odorifer]
MRKMKLNNGTKKGTFFIMIIVCCAAALLVNLQSVKANSPVLDEGDNQASTGAELNHALVSLIDLGKETTVSDSPLRLVLKWQGESSSYADLSAEVAELSTSLGLNVPSGTEEDGHMTYRTEAVKPYESRLSLFWSELSAGNSYVIVTLDTADLQNEAGFQAAAREVSMILEQNKIKAEWNVSLQGSAQEQGAPEKVLAQTESLMDEQFEAVTGGESYKDISTVSRTYSIPNLNRSVMSGNQSVSAQIAVHHEDQKGTNRVTIGFPLITIEY